MITNRTVIALALVLLTVAVLAVNGPGISAEKILMGDSNCTVIEDADTVRYTDENCPSRIYIRCESVMDGAFAGVSKLKEVWMDGCVASVGEGAFEGCANLYRFNKGPGPWSWARGRWRGVIPLPP